MVLCAVVCFVCTTEQSHVEACRRRYALNFSLFRVRADSFRQNMKILLRLFGNNTKEYALCNWFSTASEKKNITIDHFRKSVCGAKTPDIHHVLSNKNKSFFCFVVIASFLKCSFIYLKIEVYKVCDVDTQWSQLSPVQHYRKYSTFGCILAVIVGNVVFLSLSW